MCRTQWLLALVAVYVGLANSWDIAVGIKNQLIFYTNGTETNTVDFISQKIAALAYDEVHNRMFYVDKQSNNDAICGYGISSRKNKCFIKRTGGSIHSIAFDPVTQTLFFTDTNYKSISCISLKSGSANNVKANLIKMDDGTPKDIAVDFCRGYIYWINTNMTDKYYKTSIERAQFNGSGREIILKTIGEEFEVLSLAIDPLTQKIYYLSSDGNVLEHLNYVDLDGQHDRFMYGYFGPYNSLRELTVSENYLYWVDTTKSYNTVWQLPKSANLDSRPKKISDKFSTKEPLAIATNYKIEDQIQGLEDCDALSGLIPMITVTDKSLNIEQTTEYTTDVCNWTPDYILQITCSNCNSGYTGERCEVSVCCGYCSNNGTCSLNENSEPVCECKQDYVGDRCEVYNNNNKAQTTKSSTTSTSTSTSTTTSTSTSSTTSTTTSTSTSTTTTTNDHNDLNNNNNNNNRIVNNNSNSNNSNNNNNRNMVYVHNIKDVEMRGIRLSELLHPREL